MALAYTFRAAIFSTTAATAYATTSTYQPAANSLLIAFVVGCSTTVVDPDGATPFAGHGLTWTKVTLTANDLSTTHATSVWVANSGGSSSTAACTATWGSNRTGGVVVEFEVTGWDTNLTAAQAVLQNPTATGTGTSSSITALVQKKAGSRVIAFNLHLANEATTPKASPAWTETAGADGNFNSPTTGAEVEFLNSAFDGSPTASWSTSSLWRMVALEVAAANVAMSKVAGLTRNLMDDTARVQNAAIAKISGVTNP